VTYQPQSDNYKGRLYILINGGSFSAASSFVDIVYYYRDKGRQATFIGEQNGSNTGFGRGSGGQTLSITLPQSKLGVGIPLLGGTLLNRNLKVKIPDYEVSPSATDIANGIDRELEFAKSLCRIRSVGTK
jgi:hypothetical protein